MSPPPATKPRVKRTAAQLAALHQAKANQARAKAAKEARDRETRALIAIGKALVAAVLDGKHTVRLADGRVAGGAVALDALTKGYMKMADMEVFVDWWLDKGYPQR